MTRSSELYTLQIWCDAKRVPHPFSMALHEQVPNEVRHISFQYTGNTDNIDMRFVLVIKDALSSYIWVHPYASPDSESATASFSKWILCLEA